MIYKLFLYSLYYSGIIIESKIFQTKTYSNAIYRYVSRVMYDGSRFKGFQDLTKRNQESNEDLNDKSVPYIHKTTQHINTVQGILKSTLSARFSYPVSVIGASRTDAGVHARGQTIHFDLTQPIQNLQNFEFTMNRLLPNDIQLYNVSLAPGVDAEGNDIHQLWHATKSANSKIYTYTFCTNKYVDPMMRRYCGHVYFPVDMELLEECLKLFEGTHDFAAFSNQVNCKQKEFMKKNMTFSTIKTIYSIKLIPLNDVYCFPSQTFATSSSSSSSSSSSLSHLSVVGGSICLNDTKRVMSVVSPPLSPSSSSGYFRIEIHLNSALYRMIRNIVWACAYTAAGVMKYEELVMLLTPSVESSSNAAAAAADGNSNAIETLCAIETAAPIVTATSGAAVAIRAVRCRNIAKPAPPEGLCLETVLYDHY